MEYNNSSQSSIDVDHFEFNVTSPTLNTRRKKIKKLAVGKLVDQVKKFKKQAPKIHDDGGGNNDIGYHSNDPISIYDSENHPQQHHKFLLNIRRYNSSHLHVITSIIHSEDDDDDDNGQKRNASKSRHYLKMSKPAKKYFKKKQKPKDQTSIDSCSSPSSSTTPQRRKRLQISLANKKKRLWRESLIRIRQQIMNFEIPADWTCTSSKVNKNPTTTKVKAILENNSLLHGQMDEEMKRIQSIKTTIEDYMNKLKQLDMDVHQHHLQLVASIDTKSKGIEMEVEKSRHLLQQAYSRHLKLATKDTMNPSIRLENLQIKVQSLHKSHFFLGLRHCKRWAFSFVLIGLCILFYLKRINL